MASLSKLLRHMRNQPGAVRFGDAVRVLEAKGFREANVVGSHHRFIHEGHPVEVTLVRPHGREAYLWRREVQRLLEALDEVKAR